MREVCGVIVGARAVDTRPAKQECGGETGAKDYAGRIIRGRNGFEFRALEQTGWMSERPGEHE